MSRRHYFIFVFPGLVHGDAGGNVDRWCDWTVELECLLQVIKKNLPSLIASLLFPDCRFVIAWICTGVGAIGMLWLWWRWRKNYLWALNQIFMYVKVPEKSAK